MKKQVVFFIMVFGILPGCDFAREQIIASAALGECVKNLSESSEASEACLQKADQLHYGFSFTQYLSELHINNPALIEKARKKKSRKRNPTQAEVDASLGYLLGLAAKVAGSSCVSCEYVERFQSVFSEVRCGGGGRVEFDIGSCRSDGIMSVRAHVKKCNLGYGNILKGKAKGKVTITSEGASFRLKTRNYKIQGIPYTALKGAKRPTATASCVDGKISEPICTGEFLVGKKRCIIDSGCSSCLLQ